MAFEEPMTCEKAAGGALRARSLEMQDRAKRLIPGMSQLLSKRPDQFSAGVWPGYFSRAEGAQVWDLDGNRYLDMSISGIGANVLGYCDPDVNAAVVTAVQNGNSSSLNCPEEIVLAELLIELHPWAERVRYARTGGESMAIAVRIARAATGRDVVAFCGYHGWHDWYLAANLGSADALAGHLLPGLEPAGVPKALAGTALPFGYNRLGELEGIISARGRQIGAIVMEPIRSQPPDPGFLPGVRAAADRIGAVLVFDEISSGFRLNTGGAHLELGVEPDIAVFSKAMGNGYAIGAIIGRAAVMEAAQSTFISSTYWTERIGPAAAIATIRKHRGVDAGKHLVALGRAVQDGWRGIAARHGLPIHVGGIPPLSHFALESPEASSLHAYFVQLMLDKGFLAGPRFYSMLAHTRTHVDMYLDACASIADARLKRDVPSRLRGAPASAGFRRLA
jgi:glutamate-1-semialdehyde 2,1-aminomutase